MKTAKGAKPVNTPRFVCVHEKTKHSWTQKVNRANVLRKTMRKKGGGKRMKEELTREVLEAIANCNKQIVACGVCVARCFCNGRLWNERCNVLATALLAERAKPKVWDGAPEWATIGRACWTDKKHGEAWSTIYRRELPKTRTRQIAENIIHGINGVTHGEAKDIEYVEGVLNKYAEELTNTKETR
jgi:hypothetical protein